MEETYADEAYSEEEVEQHPAEKLRGWLSSDNIADELDAEQLAKIGREVVHGYEVDDNSRVEWKKQTKQAMDLALQVCEEKSFPWPKASNVKYPLITTAAIQFNARAYPAIVQGNDVVKGVVNGPDHDGSKQERADRIGHHMSYQLLEEMQEWDEDTDKLLLQVPIVGCAFRKTYFDPTLGRNVSELCAAKNVVYNHTVPFNKLRRITHELFLYKNEAIEKTRSGLWREIELGLPEGEDNDEDGSFEFLEQHCWYDLDDDGYKEPYIVTVRKSSAEVVRIVPRFSEDGIYLNGQGEVAKIEPDIYFTKYGFLPNPDGGSYDIGLGVLLNPINESINTTLNQLFDAGTLSNTGGGFIGSGLRMGKNKGNLRFQPGEFKPIDSPGGAIRDQIYHMEFPGPSPVLFNLLGLLIEAGKDISSVKDILTGEQSANETATTTMARIEQGLKAFTAVYKRLHRSLRQELRKLFRLNKLYMQPEAYFRYLDQAQPIYLQDYQGDDTDVSPISDPNLVSDAQELAKAEAMMRFSGDPMVNQLEIRKRYFQALKEENVDSLLQEAPPQQPDPRMAEMMAKIEVLQAETSAKIDKMEAETAKIKADAIKALAEAEAVEIGNQMQIYMGQFEALLNEKLLQRAEEANGQAGIRGMEGAPGDQGSDEVPAGLPTAGDGAMGGGGIQPSDLGSESLQEFGSDLQESGVPGPIEPGV